MDLTYDFNRDQYIIFCAPINQEMTKDHLKNISRWFYRQTKLPKRKIEVLSDVYIPVDYIYIIGYREMNEYWEVLAKILVTEYEGKKEDLH